jgi:hypothetical protein
MRENPIQKQTISSKPISLSERRSLNTVITPSQKRPEKPASSATRGRSMPLLAACSVSALFRATGA